MSCWVCVWWGCCGGEGDEGERGKKRRKKSGFVVFPFLSLSAFLYRKKQKQKLKLSTHQHQVRVLVHPDEVPGLERLGVHEADHGQEDRLPRRRLQNDALAPPPRVGVCCRAVLFSFLLAVGPFPGGRVEDLDDVADEVGELVVELDLFLVLLDLFVCFGNERKGRKVERGGLLLASAAARIDGGASERGAPFEGGGALD